MVAVNLRVRFATKIVTRARSAWFDTRSWEVECMVRISYHIMLQIVKRSSLLPIFNLDSSVNIYLKSRSTIS